MTGICGRCHRESDVVFAYSGYCLDCERWLDFLTLLHFHRWEKKALRVAA